MSISATDVKNLRDATGAGMMDCKKALQESNGDFEAALDYLRKKGIAAAKKREGRETKEGTIYSYIHPGAKVGVMVEMNCETDFVANTDDFLDLAKNVAMHIAAASPESVSREELDQERIVHEMSIYKEQALASGKPEAIIEKIATGKMEKFYQEAVLMEQAYVRDPDKTIKDLLTDAIGKLGENISVRRFARFQLGA